MCLSNVFCQNGKCATADRKNRKMSVKQNSCGDNIWSATMIEILSPHRRKANSDRPNKTRLDVSLATHTARLLNYVSSPTPTKLQS